MLIDTPSVPTRTVAKTGCLLGRYRFLIDTLVLEQAGFIKDDAILVIVEPDGVRVAPDHTDLPAVRSVQCVAQDLEDSTPFSVPGTPGIGSLVTAATSVLPL